MLEPGYVEKSAINDQCHNYLVNALSETVIAYTVEVGGSLHTPRPNTFKLSFSQFLTFKPSKHSLY